MRKLLCAALAVVLAASAILLAGCGGANEEEAIEMAAGSWALLEGGEMQTSAEDGVVPDPTGFVSASKWLQFEDHTMTYYEGSEPKNASWSATMKFSVGSTGYASFELEGGKDYYYVGIYVEERYKNNDGEEVKGTVSDYLMRVVLRRGTSSSYAEEEYIAYKIDNISSASSFSLENHFTYAAPEIWTAQKGVEFYSRNHSYPVSDTETPVNHGVLDCVGADPIVYISNDEPGVCLLVLISISTNRQTGMIEYSAYEFDIAYVDYSGLNVSGWES